eukprot:scaffold300917_cov18-Prasinocladus_malaysianus.AAC.1
MHLFAAGGRKGSEGTTISHAQRTAANETGAFIEASSEQTDTHHKLGALGVSYVTADTRPEDGKVLEGLFDETAP